MNIFIKKALILTPFVLILSTSTAALAEKSDCDADVVHCAYVTGIDKKDGLDGRYVKVVIKGPMGDSTTTQCFNNTSTIAFGPKMAKDFQGKNSFTFYICKDKAGTQCSEKSVGVDNFTVTGTTAEPQYYNLDLSSVQADYPSCKVVDSKVDIF